MEPTVFCLVVPMMFNICSDPLTQMPVREKRSITINTGNESGSSEGQVVSTAQTDKQLIINIETKVLPQFNVYLDSLAQSPRMQCTTNDDSTDGDLKKRIFTCTPLSNNCCPSSTLTCVCSEKSADQTKVNPKPNHWTTAVPATKTAHTDFCKGVCQNCPLTIPSPITTSTPGTTTLPIDFCKGVCEFCTITTPFPITTSIPQTTSQINNCKGICEFCIPTTPIPSDLLVPHSLKCLKLCQQCSLKQSTTMQPQTTQTTDNCLSICKNCQSTFTEVSTLPISTTAMTPTTTRVPPKPDNCKDICDKCTSTTAVSVPGTLSCENLCQSCKSSSKLIPGSVQCTIACKNCKVKSKLDCLALCNKCKPRRAPNPEQCKQICSNCKPVPRTAPTDKCISCKVLCKKCGFKSQFRTKRDVQFEADESVPLVVNIERVHSENPCETGKRPRLHNMNSESVFKHFAEDRPAVSEKCKNLAAYYKPKVENCVGCNRMNKIALSSEIVSAFELKTCPNLCKQCINPPILKAEVNLCFNVCKHCLNNNKQNSLTLNRNKCYDLCKKCKIPIQKITPEQCNFYCPLCKAYEKPNLSTPASSSSMDCINLCSKCINSSLAPIKLNSKQCKINCQLCRAREKPTTPTPFLPPSSNDCLNLCKNCVRPNPKQCQDYCRLCKGAISTTTSPLPETCEEQCAYCKQRTTPKPPPSSSEKNLKITRTNCTNDNNIN